jgi:hypothetical protein
MQNQATGRDWIFISGITFAVASTAAFGAIAVYVLMNAPR